ncbi:MAG: hypothetical protein LC742_00195 [Acidobacteria bacterium]|nr:hypothetical protein [Acidobacteriota bacterium]
MSYQFGARHMSLASSPYIHAEGDDCTFAVRLTRAATLTALNARGDDYFEQLFARQIDWLTCLVNSRDERFTYDLRFYSRPHPELYVRGRLDIALLCRMKEATVAQAEDRARQLLRLCRAYFEDEYEFEPAANAPELDALRRPFPVRAAMEVTRRFETLTLDTLRHAPRRLAPGFVACVPAPPAPPESGIFYVYPYLLST